jgi:uncharacterized protein YneF (UPF0154 family)
MHELSAYFWNKYMNKYIPKNPPIKAKIGALVAKNVKGSLRLDASILR